MSTADNKRLANRVWQEIWHQGDLERIDEFFAADFTRHDPGGREIRGPDENRQFVTALRTAFPDLSFTVLDEIAEGDRIAVRYRFQGTHLGDFQGMPPTRKQASYSGMLIYRIAGGKIAEQWTEIDLLSLLRQLGALKA